MGKSLRRSGGFGKNGNENSAGENTSAYLKFPSGAISATDVVRGFAGVPSA